MNFHTAEKDQGFRSLVEMGTKGFYPLFHQDWLDDAYQDIQNILTKKEQVKAKEIIGRLLKHKSIERKKIVLLSLAQNERTLFVRAFLGIVEGKILDRRPGIQ